MLDAALGDLNPNGSPRAVEELHRVPVGTVHALIARRTGHAHGSDRGGGGGGGDDDDDDEDDHSSGGSIGGSSGAGADADGAVVSSGSAV